MRWLTMTAVCAGVATAGCEQIYHQSSKESAPVAAALAAFQAGDRPALEAAIATLEPPASAAEPTPCSAEAFATARRIGDHAFAEELDNSTLMSMSDEARYVFLESHYTHSDAWNTPGAASPADGCKANPNMEVLGVDNLERSRIQVAISDRLQAWREVLTTKHGEALDNQLGAAALTLTANHFDAGQRGLNR